MSLRSSVYGKIYRPSGAGEAAGLADLCACPGCGSLVETGVPACPTCGRWLGRYTPLLWGGLVIAGSLLVTGAFFLPWLDGAQPWHEPLSGYDLARIAQRLSGREAGARPTAAASLALYLAPLAGLLMLALLLLTPALGWPWRLVGRLLVGLAAIPCQITLLAVIFANGPLADSAGGMELGGPGRSFLRWRGLSSARQR
jgi:hypothetical protein